MTPCNTVARTDVVRVWGGFYDRDQCRFGEDGFLWLKILLRMVSTAIVAATLALVVSFVLHRLDEINSPAGFRRGLVHGALMPMSFPNLIVGDDVTINAVKNTGVPYKLGYALGVNGAGLMFFGFLFWRLRRLKRE